MQVLDRRKAMAIAPLWRLAFRPFFLAGCVLALLAIPPVSYTHLTLPTIYSV